MEFDDQKVEENNGVTFNTSMVSTDIIILSDTVADHAEFLRRVPTLGEGERTYYLAKFLPKTA